MSRPPLSSLAPGARHKSKGTWLGKGWLVQTQVGIPMADRIRVVIDRENITISDFIRIAANRLLEEYEE